MLDERLLKGERPFGDERGGVAVFQLGERFSRLVHAAEEVAIDDAIGPRVGVQVGIKIFFVGQNPQQRFCPAPRAFLVVKNGHA
ncbi:MAG: hypothetical protein M5R36_21680 [Deltaproteobacteria bacterium]|nr:hypothetical protein [Deltaproteobacteria bacterium]